MKETFGEYIRRLRTEHKMTLTQLAAKLNMDSANLSKVENGRRDFDEKRLELLAGVFDLEKKMLLTEYHSDMIAKKIYKSNLSEQILVLAEQKIKYFKQKNSRQGELNL